ncbi:LysM domain-containing protein [Chryseobacterium arachidis]|uniref:LysM domain-containing protein n=1 Tax=Chryseobacterium arachidis TaxID=1416778 RepID=A0A1M5ETW2_9FLAO|nr:LysM domain-containing protein [Chryseobacterium arachidis]SHF82678.1 LysM domain-containing protein [Chryseobacterium arachidis]
MQKFNKHTVAKNETLKSIASRYDLSVGELKLFHNNHCNVKDMILIGLTDQKELFIPRTAVADKAKRVEFSHGNRLAFKPQNLFLRYGVTITLEKGDHINELKYENSVKWLKTENRLHFFEIDRISDLFINEEQVNEMADLLAYKTSKVLYPLQISTDENGKFNAVENLSEYAKRWNNVKDEVYKEYEGEIVDEYCLKIERILDEPELLTGLMKNDYFLRTVFFGIYKSFGKDFKTINQESFPVIQNPKEPNYEITFEIDPIKDEHDLVNITGNGKLHDERSVYDFISGTPFSFIIEDHPVMNDKGDFRIKFYLNGKTYFPESLYLECDILLQEKKKIAVSISVLD